MKSVWIARTGGPEVLEVREAPEPEPKAGEVRIAVSRSGINFADLMARVGLYPDAPPVPCVVGYEVAGVVDAVGAGVSKVKEGDRVMGMPRFGGYSSAIALPEAQVIPMPADMSFDEGAALPVVYLTAYCAMLFTGNLRAGSRVLVHSAAGGVGLAAIQLAQTRRCEIFGLASRGKHEFLKKQGVAHVFAPDDDWPTHVRALVGERGLDLVLDPVGGRSWKTGMELLGPCGRLVCFGLSAAAPEGNRRSLLRAAWSLLQVPGFKPTRLMDENKSITGINLGHLFDRIDLLEPQFAALVELYREGAIKPVVSKVFPAEDAPAAHQYLHDRKAIGKVLLGW